MTEEQIRALLVAIPTADLIALVSEGTVPSRFVYDEFLSRTKGCYEIDTPDLAAAWLRGYAAGDQHKWGEMSR